ncbi:MAG: ankyrin repeat domain-containing protein [Rhodospirillales bacterium]|nr:ankyrin repeat domain-containing protein [Rhodospirillales bacterium]
MILLVMTMASLLYASRVEIGRGTSGNRARSDAAAGTGRRTASGSRLRQYLHVDELLDAGVDVNARTLDGATAPGVPFTAGSQDGELLIARGADVNAHSNRGVTALHQAAWEDYAEIVAMLLQRGADPNARSNGGETPLMWAAMKGHDDVARLLIANGADINATTDTGATAASLARNSGHADIAGLLQAAGQ